MKAIYKLLFGLILVASLSIMISSCVKDEFDKPDPYEFRVNFSANTTIADLLALYDGDTTLINDSIIIRGTVISTDKHGNFYKDIVIQDSTGGIAISIDRAPLFNDYPMGSEMFIKCNDMYLGESNGVIKLGGLYEENGAFLFGRLQSWQFVQDHCFRDDYRTPIIPDTITLNEFNTSRINTLVVIKDVQFTEGNLGKTYATPGGTSGMNRSIEDCDKNSQDLRTSDFADFAGDTVPSGKGTIKAVLSYYNNAYQLLMNSIDDIDFSGERCADPNIVSQDFLTGLGTWMQYSIVGDDQVWHTESYGYPDPPCAVMKGYDGTNHNENEDWLISPAFNSNDHENLILNFETASNYSGDDIEILISTNYSGTGDPNNASWTELTATLSTGNFDWTNSGDIDISNFKGNNVYVAFKYTSTNSAGKTWEVDTIVIYDPNL